LFGHFDFGLVAELVEAWILDFGLSPRIDPPSILPSKAKVWDGKSDRFLQKLSQAG
jgi:hypothetical protein